MTIHAHHPPPASRAEFLVDGCARCSEYVADLGLHFTPDRWAAFWEHMLTVEFCHEGGYASTLDSKLGMSLFKVALGFSRAYGIDWSAFARQQAAGAVLTASEGWPLPGRRVRPEGTEKPSQRC